jgi:hypothetical protein
MTAMDADAGASRTAVLVCQRRAAAHGRIAVDRFSDPVAPALLRDGERDRIGPLTPLAGSLRFTPVDFTRDQLDPALAAAGHDPARPTTWVWEGVVVSWQRCSATMAFGSAATKTS